MSEMIDYIFEHMEHQSNDPTRTDGERELISLHLHELKTEFARLEKIVADPVDKSEPLK